MSTETAASAPPLTARDLERSLIITALRYHARGDLGAASCAAAAAVLLDWMRHARPVTADAKAAQIAGATADAASLAKALDGLAAGCGVDAAAIASGIEEQDAGGSLGAPRGVPECRRCARPVAVPRAGVFGQFCEACISRCHESAEPGHRCAVCAPEYVP